MVWVLYVYFSCSLSLLTDFFFLFLFIFIFLSIFLKICFLLLSISPFLLVLSCYTCWCAWWDFSEVLFIFLLFLSFLRKTNFSPKISTVFKSSYRLKFLQTLFQIKSFSFSRACEFSLFMDCLFPGPSL